MGAKLEILEYQKFKNTHKYYARDVGVNMSIHDYMELPVQELEAGKKARMLLINGLKSIKRARKESQSLLSTIGQKILFNAQYSGFL